MQQTIKQSIAVGVVEGEEYTLMGSGFNSLELHETVVGLANGILDAFERCRASSRSPFNYELSIVDEAQRRMGEDGKRLLERTVDYQNRITDFVTAISDKR